MKRLKQATMMLPLAAAVSTAYATDEQTWGIAAMYRTASIPFYTANDDSTVSTFVPMMFFENEHLYINGLEGGAFLFNEEDSDWRVARLRVFVLSTFLNPFKARLKVIASILVANCVMTSMKTGALKWN